MRNMRFPVTVALVLLLLPMVALPARGQPEDDPNAAAGLVSDTSYQSPHHGYEVGWDDAWGVDPDRVDPVLWTKASLDHHQDIPVYTGDDLAYDRLDIWLTDLDARLRVVSQPATSSSGIHDLTIVSENDALGGRATTLLDVDDGPDQRIVVHRHEMNDGSILYSWNELLLGTDPDYWLWIQLVAPAASFADAFNRADADVTSDAFTFSDAVSAGDIDAASKSAPLFDVAAAGLVSATEWLNPSVGLDVTWVDHFTTYENLNAVQQDGAGGYSLVLGTKYGIPESIEIDVSGESRDESLESMVEHDIAAYESQGSEVLIAGVEGDRGIILTRDVVQGNVFVTYLEYGYASGGAFFLAQIETRQEDGQFTLGFGEAAGAVTLDGIPFGDSWDPAVIIAAANSPIED